ncbi:hypothetical protein C9374_009292 [Naegleria lovaniensis]|uniref:Uncharacterized protein n=1 Tax=Naegleria lovaniensis TaxID=51637 RepID=A0AA88KGP4_NAELO|nr:uncharacterized protein C9374_009292 [Naegleria lovaniensis]KAG2377381.1 hypothetical protein C9374_009292 [Naegleria lovaniensis]
MKNTLSSLFKKNNDKKSGRDSNTTSPLPPGEHLESSTSTSTQAVSTSNSSSDLSSSTANSPTYNNNNGSFSGSSNALNHSNSFSGGIFNHLSEGSLPESTQLCYGTVQTPFNMFELNKRMYQLNSSSLLNKLSNPSTPNSRNSLKNSLNGGSNSNASTPRASVSSGNSSPSVNSASNSTGDLNKNPTSQFTITPTLLMGKRNELNKTSTDKRNSSVSPVPENARSSSPLVTATTSTNNRQSLKKNQVEPTQDSNSVGAIVKSALNDNEKVIELIVSFLVPHKDWIKSVSNKTELSHIRTVSLLNKKWNQLYLSPQSENVNQLWNVLIVELNNNNGSDNNSETDTAASDLTNSKKFIQLCK